MKFRFEIKPQIVTAKSKEEVLKLVTEYIDDSHPSWVIGQGVLDGVLVPNWLTPTPMARLYTLQKFNAKFKKTLDKQNSKPGKKVFHVVKTRDSHWQASIYDFDENVLMAMSAIPMQYERHFEFIGFKPI